MKKNKKNQLKQKKLIVVKKVEIQDQNLKNLNLKVLIKLIVQKQKIIKNINLKILF